MNTSSKYDGSSNSKNRKSKGHSAKNQIIQDHKRSSSMQTFVSLENLVNTSDKNKRNSKGSPNPVFINSIVMTVIMVTIGCSLTCRLETAL